MDYNYRSAYPNELMHYGVMGMKWGVRRYQNPDGTLTDAGKKRYLNSDGTLNDSGKKRYGTYGIDNRPTKQDISKEALNISARETGKLINKDKQMKEWSSKIDKFDKKYRIYDDFETGDEVDDFFRDLREKARKDTKLAKELAEYDEATRRYNEKYYKYDSAGRKYADRIIIEKYGTDAKWNTNHADQIKTGAIVAGALLLSPVLVPAAIATAVIATPIVMTKQSKEHENSIEEDKKN